METTCGSVLATISAPMERAWPVAAGFYELHKWVPTVRECYEVEEGVRLVRSHPRPEDGSITWVKEKMLQLDQENHCIAYKLLEGNMGLDNYDAMLKLSPAARDGETIVSWSFRMSSGSSRQRQEQEEFLKWGILKLEEAASMP